MTKLTHKIMQPWLLEMRFFTGINYFMTRAPVLYKRSYLLPYHRVSRSLYGDQNHMFVLTNKCDDWRHYD